MKWQSIRSLLTIFAVCIISVGILSCGTDDDDTGDKITTPDPPDEIIIATAEPIDFDAEIREIQQVYGDFFSAFNRRKISDLRNIWKDHATNAQFAVVWEAGGFPEPVGPVSGWTQIESTIEGLWNAQGTRGQNWTGSNRFSQFWIRRKRSDPNSLEASARSSASFRSQGSGVTYAYLVKDEHDDWLLQQIDSITGNIINRGLNKPKITKYFTDPSAKAP